MPRKRVGNGFDQIIKRLSQAENQKPIPFNADKFNTEARKAIADKFVNGFFIILILSFLIPPIYNVIMYKFAGNDSLFISLKDVVLLTTSTIGGPLGFIVGFYFKDK